MTNKPNKKEGRNMTQLDEVTVKEALRYWTPLQPVLMQCNEQQTLQLLRAEQEGKARHWMLSRIFGHYDKLRNHRERLELLQAVAATSLKGLKKRYLTK